MERLVQERMWMYNQRVPERSYNSEAFLKGVRTFVEFAIAKGHLYEGRQMRCPCSKCKNRKFHDVDSVENHLYTYGFLKEYYNWTLHGEDIAEISYSSSEHPSNVYTSVPDYNNDLPFRNDQNLIGSRFTEMVYNVVGPSYNAPYSLPEEPNEDASQFYELLKSSQNPVFEGCTSETELSIAMKLLQTKIDHGLSEAAYDSLCNLIRKLLDCANNVPTSFRQTKKLVSDLGMGYVRIDVCVKGCMIFYQDDESLVSCRFCGESRYKQSRHGESSRRYTRIARSQMFYLPIIPRLKRLFMTEFTAAHMSWHATNRSDTNIMVHPSDAESWKHFNACYPEFAQETRNVRLGLSADGFSPFGMSTKSYSCWPVMVTPYNLPPWMCMKTRFMWLTIVIPGPRDPSKRIDIYLRPLIDDLLVLWNSGVHTYDAHCKQNFIMRAALMWTVSDFPAYAMLSGWSTKGKLGCPYCMENTKTFVLPNGRKVSYFDCHRRFLASDHPYRDNIKNFRRGRTEYDEPFNLHSGFDIYARVRSLKFIWEQQPNEKLHGFGQTHNWTKQSIFWLLPYWVNVKLRHNLDVMHTEKNIFENLFNTIMDVKGKTKDNGVKSRLDIAIYCDRPELELKTVNGKVYSAKAKHTLSTPQQVLVCEWLKQLKFPDGYASRFSNLVDLGQRKLVGYKSHDAHVFFGEINAYSIQRLVTFSHLESCV